MAGELQFVPVMLTLPDGQLVMQRRDGNPDYEKHKLGMFGGGLEPGETPEQCMRRELFDEETSLTPDNVTDLEFVMEYTIPASDEFPEDRRFHLFRGVVLVGLEDFEVYEGAGAEAHSLEGLKTRDDLMATTTYLLRKVLKLY